MSQNSEVGHRERGLGDLVFCIALSVLLTVLNVNAWERSGQCLLEVISYDRCGWTEEKHINLMQVSQCSGNDVNLTLPPKTSVDCCLYTNWLILISQDRHVETHRRKDIEI
jgi:hypothetical protein